MILCTISNEDAEKLNNTIIEVNMCEKLYKYAIEDINCTPDALKVILDYYMFALKVHKSLWRQIINQYLSEDEYTSSFNLLRFDPIEQTIFKLDSSECLSCKK